MPSPMETQGLSLGPHWVIVDDNTGTAEQWEGVTGLKGMAGITVLRLATRPASALVSPRRTSDFSSAKVGSITARRSTRWLTCSPKAPRTGMRGRWRAGHR
ncbi:ftsK/SpoIIIE family domain protein [Mycobacterium xenopi 4042]|uniref:FtsK/SpoIIIE family domain protein n=1 Tax=Mycobacterium xenopi 4042 TaxID=1299334 RepID=X8CK15_MYCXE|nr:ftsK/SpoIIIE family domain protein [Mycobacterium xenopi 4042]